MLDEALSLTVTDMPSTSGSETASSSKYNIGKKTVHTMVHVLI